MPVDEGWPNMFDADCEVPKKLGVLEAPKAGVLVLPKADAGVDAAPKARVLLLPKGVAGAEPKLLPNMLPPKATGSDRCDQCQVP